MRQGWYDRRRTAVFRALPQANQALYRGSFRTIMPTFGGASNFVINGGEFVTVRRNYNDSTGMDILLSASVPDAAVDAEKRQYAPSCFPGTRGQYINDIIRWVTAPTSERTQSLYWMKGPAGVGKSAIAQTCAERLKDAGCLGAAFFFSQNGRDDHSSLFTTIAYQLSTFLPEYRQILEHRISNDKTLVKKTIASQFKHLIFEPMKELQQRGKEIARLAIFIDGLDECRSKEAQTHIIELIAGFAQADSIPLRWAIFSRPEPSIASAFDDETISPLSRCVELSISRSANRDIELYLRSEFKNILRRRKLPISTSWPTTRDIKKLVAASAGLFAYPSVVIRFIDNYPSLRLEETLQNVLKTISPSNQAHPQPLAVSPFSELDAFYILIMESIAKDILPSVLLLLADMVQIKYDGRNWSAAELCNQLGFSQTEFRGICHQLHAVLYFQDASHLFDFGQDIEPKCSYFNQRKTFEPNSKLKKRLLGIHGIVNLYHKSFYDFLVDPSRSLQLCVTTPSMREKLFERYVQSHHHYAQRYVIQDNSLISVPEARSSDSLSWSQGTEFIDSFIMRRAFANISHRLSPNSPMSAQLLRDASTTCLEKLADLDYRKYLISEIVWHTGLREGYFILGLAGVERVAQGTVFGCIHSRGFKYFDPQAFLNTLRKLEKAGAIRPYHPNLPSSLASIYQSFSPPKPQGRSAGQYRLGHGTRSVTWYWEFDTEKKYFHQFRTVDFVRAMKLYEVEKFKMWKEPWEPSLAS
ncbi:hypothetical protein NP233_g3186 [Leucocoprinus birnbaumii]|uniref:Nephrocystin 3-like N-terminal domain-containing protein n=1 Tax=Leucocoprinus birnbaumii TaxID=56174 RepID=A0AAD5VZS3_9AGAR|nr:hypothetical protein NP233_g3186 [Leucocoprinus birnbaumii]